MSLQYNDFSSNFLRDTFLKFPGFGIENTTMETGMKPDREECHEKAAHRTESTSHCAGQDSHCLPPIPVAHGYGMF